MYVKNNQVRNFKNFVVKFSVNFLMEHEGAKFTAREIAKYILESNNDISQNMMDTSQVINNETDMLNRLVARISQYRFFMLNIKTTEGRPRKYYYTKQSDADEVEDVETKNIVTQALPLEHALYPMLIEYLNTENGLHAKRIDEKRSINNRGPKGNEWLYPDLVALEDLASEWSNKVTECAKQYGDKKAKLWSFEVKRLINISNVRSTFFQAVSNSSWANFGYLVAAELEEKAKKELHMLSSLHGIGFILLDTENPSESQVMIPARERYGLDWESINRLTEANKDFSDYIDEISNFCLTGKTKKQDWD